MTTRFHSLKVIAALGLVVLTCAGLASCGGGGGSGPASVGDGSRSSGDQLLIVPPSPNVPETQGQQDLVETPPQLPGQQNLVETPPQLPGQQKLVKTPPRLPGQQNLVKTQSQLPDQPDLVVESPTVSDSGPVTEARFTLSATVSNTGDGESPATTLRYYRSTDATITTSDTAVGTDPLAALAASGRGGESISLTAPSSPGTYYYGACVDAVTDESDTTNNCSTSVLVTVADGGEPATEVHLFTPVRVEEGDATFLIVMAWTRGDRPPTVSIPVRVWLVEGAAKEGVDFPPLSQSVTFNPSDFTFNGSQYETHQVTFPFTLLDDTEAEGDETFGGTIMLESDLPFVEVSPEFPNQGSITILDND